MLSAPEDVRRRYSGWTWSLHYGSEVVTWRLQHPGGPVRYLKVASSSAFPRVLDEATRMIWARPYLPVPQVVDYGTDGTLDWLVTAALPGRDATDEQLTRQPQALVPLLARGLRRLHAVPTDACPFDFTVDTALAHAAARVAAGLVEPEQDFHPEHAHLDADTALAELRRLRPASEDLVVTHGDYCPPNVLVADDDVSGYLDLGELAVADRWWDLAVATWAVTWNLGPGWEELFLSAYGAEPDKGRIAFYRLLYDLVS